MSLLEDAARQDLARALRRLADCALAAANTATTSGPTGGALDRVRDAVEPVERRARLLAAVQRGTARGRAA